MIRSFEKKTIPCTRRKSLYLLGCLWEDLGRDPSRMGVSVEEYRQKIGCFARVAAVLSSLKVRGNNGSTTY